MKHILPVLIIPLFIFSGYDGSTGLAREKKKKPKHEYFYIINYSFSHTMAEIEINGVPVAKSKKEFDYSSSGFTDVGQWIYPGQNNILVKVARFMDEKGGSSPFPRVQLTLSIAQKGEWTDQGKKILEFRVPETGTSGKASESTITLPFSKEIPFTPEYVPPSKLWSLAKPFTLDSDSKKLITKLVGDYYTALKKSDMNALHGLLLFRIKDLSRLRYMSADEAASHFRQELKELISMKGFAMQPLDLGALVFRPVAYGKVIWVTDATGGDPVKTKYIKDSGSITFPVYVSLIHGKWVMVR
jgi:hypothetical protein